MRNNLQVRICCWNMRRASDQSAAWQLLEELAPDVALLQEVNKVPATIAANYSVVTERAAGTTRGKVQRFSTAILSRGTIGEPIRLTSRWDWVDRELEHFRGNLLAHRVTVLGQELRVLSAYSPAWPVDPERLRDIDVTPVKLKLNPKVCRRRDRCGCVRGSAVDQGRSAGRGAVCERPRTACLVSRRS